MITLLIVLLVLAALFCIVWTVHRQDELDEREYELEQISLDLDGRANRIAAEEENIKNEWQYLRMAKEMLDKQRGLIGLGIVEDESPSGDGGENPQ